MSSITVPAVGVKAVAVGQRLSKANLVVSVMTTPYTVLQVVDVGSLVKTQVTTALLKTENKGTLLLVQSCPLPLCPLMPPLSTLNSAAVRKKVTRGQDEISFVLQRDQMLYEPQ